MMLLQLITQFVSFRSNHSTNVDNGVGLAVLHQEYEWVIHIEEFGVPQLVCAKDAGVKVVSFHIQLHG